jgi:hypothetical protein
MVNCGVMELAWEAPMALYRCDFLSSEGKVFCTEDVDGDTDDHAIEKVRRRRASLGHTRPFELWRGNVHIYSEVRNASIPSVSRLRVRGGV